LACLYGQKGCAEALIAAGCKLDPINSEDGTTPLHDAAAGGYAGIAQLLFDKAGLGMVPLLVSKCSVVSGFQ
jgi:ankyrin repeat protein